ncbi:hypothetical protein STEG23_007803, partial [Scotinomys teguina]
MSFSGQIATGVTFLRKIEDTREKMNILAAQDACQPGEWGHRVSPTLFPPVLGFLSHG